MDAAAALFDLAQAYRQLPYVFFRASGLDAATAADRVESLLARLVEDGRVCEVAASFRDCLLRLSREALTQPQLREAVIVIDRGLAEARFIQEPARPAETLFQRRWALTVVERALADLEQEYVGSGRGTVFEALHTSLGYGPFAEAETAAAAQRLGVSPADARGAVSELRNAGRRHLRAAVADTVLGSEAIEDELTALLCACDATATAGDASLPAALRGLKPQDVLLRGLEPEEHDGSEAAQVVPVRAAAAHPKTGWSRPEGLPAAAGAQRKSAALRTTPVPVPRPSVAARQARPVPVGFAAPGMSARGVRGKISIPQWLIIGAVALAVLAAGAYLPRKPERPAEAASTAGAKLQNARNGEAPLATADSSQPPALSTSTPRPVPASATPSAPAAARQPAAITKAPAPMPAPAPAAEPAPMAAAPAPKPGAETEKWLVETAAPFQASYQREVIGPFDAAVAALTQKYLVAVDRQIATATQAGKLGELVGLREERQRAASGKVSAADDARAPAKLAPLRVSHRAALGKLEQERASRARALFDRYDKALAAMQTALTQRQRPDEAALVKSKRDEIAAAWLPPGTSASPTIPGVASRAPAGPRIVATRAAQREAMDWILAVGGELTIAEGNRQTTIKLPAELPAGRYEVTSFELRQGGKKWEVPPKDEDFRRLGALRAVRKITIRNAEISDAAFEFLSEMKECRQIDLLDLPFSDAIVDHLASLDRLEGLQIRAAKTEFTGRTLEKLAKLSKLERLEIQGVAVGDEALAGVGKITSLEQLRLHGAKVTDAGLAHLVRLKNLELLALNGTAVTTAGMAALKPLKSLKSVGFLHSGLADFPAAARQLALALPGLEDLRITGRALTAAHLGELTAFRGLKRLHFPNAELSAEAIAALRPLSKIEELELTKASLDEASIEALLGMKGLTRLDLRETPLNDAGLLKLRALKNLVLVQIARTPCTAGGARALERELPGCKVIR